MIKTTALFWAVGEAPIGVRVIILLNWRCRGHVPLTHYLLHPKDSIQEMIKSKVNLYTQSSLLAQLHLLPYTYIYITASDVGHGRHHIWSINRRSAIKVALLKLVLRRFLPKMYL